jgi:hypothetical protein
MTCLELTETLGTGFLPARTPLIGLPEPFAFIAAACDELPARYHGIGLDCRPWLDTLFASRDAAQLVAAAEALDVHSRESLMMKTSLLAHAYRWVGMPTDPANYAITSLALPPVLEALWSRLAELLKIPRVGIFYTMICHNWALQDKGGGAPYDIADVTTENVSIIHSWLNSPERQELQSFILAALTMEAQGSAVVRHARLLINAIQRNNAQEATYRLVLLEATIAAIAANFNQQIRKQNMTLSNFLKLIQPTMVWLLDHGEGPLEGASGPQSVTLQLLDSLLGVPRDSELGSMIVNSRKYMLPQHIELLEAADGARETLRAFVEKSQDARLRDIYNQCLKTLLLWRISHQKRGAMYIAGEKHEPRPNYTSTGLVVTLGGDQAGLFQATMEPHIDATRARAFNDTVTGSAFTFDRLFRYLDREAAEALKGRIRKRSITQGAAIIRSGERYPGLFVIEDGEAWVRMSGSRDDAPPLAVIAVGEIFGEVSFIDNSGASADVVAQTDVTLSYLSISDLYELIAQQPDIEARLYLSLAQVMAQRLRRQAASVPRH